MSKGDFPPLRMRVERGHLVPAGPFDAERLNSYRNGAIVMCRFTEERERVLIKKWFAIIGLVLKTCDTPWKTRDEAHEAIKLALGIVNLSKTVGGEFMAYPKSLTELDDPEMTEALENMTELLSRITGVDVATLKKETAHLGQEDTADEPSSPESSDGEDADSAPASEGEGQAASQPSPSHYTWLFNVARMLVAATNYKGDITVLKNQKRAAIEAYPKPENCPPVISGKAEACFQYCCQIVAGTLEPQDGLALIAGIVGCDQDDLQPRRRGAA